MLKSKDVKLSDVYENYIITPTDFSSISVVLGDSDISVTVQPTDVMNVISTYLSWLMPYPYSDSTAEPTDTTAFINRFRAFTTRKKRVYDRVAVALYTDYSPIDNYDKHSDITTKNPEVTTTNVIASRTDSSTLGTRTTHNKETAYNDLTPKEAEQIIQDGVTDSATRGGGTDTSTISSHNVEVTEYTHGNIGVEKSSNIAKEEINFRLAYDLAAIIVADFITEYCYLI